LNQDTVMRFPLIVPERTDPAHSRVSQALARLGLPLNIAFEVGTIEAVKHYVSLGLGLGVVSGICLSPADVGKIEAIEIPKDYGGTTDYGVVLRRDKFIGSALGRFLAALGLR
jgi:DNA-binding transcriptional LysR family regulator